MVLLSLTHDKRPELPQHYVKLTGALQWLDTFSYTLRVYEKVRKINHQRFYIQGNNINKILAFEIKLLAKVVVHSNTYKTFKACAYFVFTAHIAEGRLGRTVILTR